MIDKAALCLRSAQEQVMTGATHLWSTDEWTKPFLEQGV